MSLLRGVLAAYNSTPHTATVRLDGATPQTLGPIAVDRGIAAAAMVAGRKVLIDTGRSGELDECVLLAIWGA
ncbi:MAG: hypothetical protein ACKVVT_10105 [Dehalococcoidia bacterium]